MGEEGPARRMPGQLAEWQAVDGQHKDQELDTGPPERLLEPAEEGSEMGRSRLWG